MHIFKAHIEHSFIIFWSFKTFKNIKNSKVIQTMSSDHTELDKKPKTERYLKNSPKFKS